MGSEAGDGGGGVVIGGKPLEGGDTDGDPFNFISAACCTITEQEEEGHVTRYPS